MPANAFQIVTHQTHRVCSTWKFAFICMHTCINIATLNVWYVRADSYMCICVCVRACARKQAGSATFPFPSLPFMWISKYMYIYSRWNFICLLLQICSYALSFESFVRCWKTIKKIFRLWYFYTKTLESSRFKRRISISVVYHFPTDCVRCLCIHKHTWSSTPLIHSLTHSRCCRVWN